MRGAAAAESKTATGERRAVVNSDGVEMPERAIRIVAVKMMVRIIAVVVIRIKAQVKRGPIIWPVAVIIPIVVTVIRVSVRIIGIAGGIVRIDRFGPVLIRRG